VRARVQLKRESSTTRSAILVLAASACGARTGLEPIVDAGVLPDARPDAADVAPDAPSLLCPSSPPLANTSCPSSTTAVECAYLGATPGITVWDCVAGGWVNDTTVADEGFGSCSDIVCTSGVEVECVVGQGEQCCTCSADNTADQCGGC
jgi:hypothetical protein